MDLEDLHQFEKLYGQLGGLKSELEGLSAKDAATFHKAVSAIKLQLVHQLIEKANAFLGPEHAPFEGFARFPGDNPTHSDVTLVLGQYVLCFEAYRYRHVELRHGKWYWAVEVEADGKKRQEYVPARGMKAED